MAYSTVQMVRQALFPFPADYDGTDVPSPASHTGADIDNPQMIDAIAEADSVIDSYIGKYYAVPVAVIISGENEDGTDVGTVPHPIDYWSRNIAAYNVTLSYRQGLDFSDEDPVARRYAGTMAALLLISKGGASLQIPENVSGTSGTGAGKAINPYVGDLFDARDWNLRPMNPAWPFWADTPVGGNW